MSGSFFIHFIMSSIASSVAALLIFLVKKALKKHISTRWHYNLDLLFLILLVVPFIPSGLFGFLSNRNWLNSLHFGGSTAANVNETVDAGNGLMYVNNWLQDFTVSVNRSTPEYLSLIFMGIWLVGIIAFATYTLFCNGHLRLIKESMKSVESEEILSLFTRCKAELSIKNNILLGTSILVKTPITVGVFKTRIILPAEKLSASNTYYALLHELTHCKSRDIQINSVMCLFQVIYWFNPVVYLVFKEMRLDREIACDTSVLKLIPEELHIDYGKALLNYVTKLSKSNALSFATDMGGSKPQIMKRVKNIASYTTESTMLKTKSVAVFALVCLIIFGQVPAISAFAAYDNDKYYFKADNVEYEDLSAFFESSAQGFNGSFVLYDMDADSYTIHNKDKSVTRVSPASTYKIYSGLIALENGVINTDNSVREWDGTTYPFEAWNKDQNLTSAIQNSVSWYFQAMDAQIGMKELDSYFTRLSYGNHDLSGRIADYWMESSLRISPVEQVKLLKNFYRNDTIFKAENVNALKDTLHLSEKNGATLSGKTGTGSVNGKVINGWFIGYVEKGNHTYIFATYIQGKDDASGSAAVLITLSILRDKGIY